MKKSPKAKLHHGVSGSAITVHVTPNAKETALERILPDGTLQVRLQFASSAGAGNDALLAYLADVLGASVKQFDLVAGRDGDDKLIAITNLDTATVQQRVMQAIKAAEKR